MEEQYNKIEEIYKKAMDLALFTMDKPDNNLTLGTFKGILNGIFCSNQTKEVLGQNVRYELGDRKIKELTDSTLPKTHKFIEALTPQEFLTIKQWALKVALEAHDKYKGVYETAENIVNWLLCQDDTKLEYFDLSKEILKEWGGLSSADKIRKALMDAECGRNKLITHQDRVNAIVDILKGMPICGLEPTLEAVKASVQVGTKI